MCPSPSPQLWPSVGLIPAAGSQSLCDTAAGVAHASPDAQIVDAFHAPGTTKKKTLTVL